MFTKTQLTKMSKSKRSEKGPPLEVRLLFHAVESPNFYEDPILDIIAIDHLPSMFPQKSSESFSSRLLPHLIDLEKGSPVWDGAQKLFEDKLKEL